MTMHELSFTVGAKSKNAIFGLYESNKNATDFGLIDKGVDGFNAKSNKLISKYGYNVINNKSVQVEILFKHMFKMMNETRKYVVAKVDMVSDTKISIKFSPTLVPGIAIPATAERMPLKLLIAEYTPITDSTDFNVSVKFQTTVSMNESDTFPMLTAFMQEGVSETLSGFNDIIDSEKGLTMDDLE
jgi:hypothetical protein